MASGTIRPRTCKKPASDAAREPGLHVWHAAPGEIRGESIRPEHAGASEKDRASDDVLASSGGVGFPGMIPIH